MTDSPSLIVHADFAFSLFAEMHNVGAPVKLFAAAVDGSVRQYDKVQLWGGNSDDMPVNGNLSVESDRALIRELQEKLELCFGLHSITSAAEQATAAGGVFASGKLVSDEHVDHFCKEYAGAESLHAVPVLDLSQNQLTDAIIPTLIEFLDATMPKLRRLDLSYNLLTDRACHQLLQWLGKPRGGQQLAPPVKQVLLRDNLLTVASLFGISALVGTPGKLQLTNPPLQLQLGSVSGSTPASRAYVKEECAASPEAGLQVQVSAHDRHVSRKLRLQQRTPKTTCLAASVPSLPPAKRAPGRRRVSLWRSCKQSRSSGTTGGESSGSSESVQQQPQQLRQEASAGSAHEVSAAASSTSLSQSHTGEEFFQASSNVTTGGQDASLQSRRLPSPGAARDIACQNTRRLHGSKEVPEKGVSTHRHTCVASRGTTERQPRSSLKGERRSSWDIAKEALVSGNLLSMDSKLMEASDRGLSMEEWRKKRRDSLTSGDEVWGRHGAEPKSRPERVVSRRSHSRERSTSAADTSEGEATSKLPVLPNSGESVGEARVSLSSQGSPSARRECDDSSARPTAAAGAA